MFWAFDSSQHLKSKFKMSFFMHHLSMENPVDAKVFYKNFSLLAGVKNLFNVTRINNSAVDSGGAHTAGGGAVPMSYGRSYFLGLSAQISKH